MSMPLITHLFMPTELSFQTHCCVVVFVTVAMIKRNSLNYWSCFCDLQNKVHSPTGGSMLCIQSKMIHYKTIWTEYAQAVYISNIRTQLY